MEEDYNTSHDLISVPKWKTSMRMDDEVLELVWQNGSVVANSQNSRRTAVPDNPLKFGGQLETRREDETIPWFQYLLDESLERDVSFDSYFGLHDSEIPSKPRNDVNVSNKAVKFGSSNAVFSDIMPLLPVQQISNNAVVDSRLVNSSQFSSSTRGDAGSINDVAQSSSTATKASCNFCTKLVKNQHALQDTLMRNVLLDNVTKHVSDSRTEVRGSRLTTTTATTSSVASGSSIAEMVVQQQSTLAHNKSHKRKFKQEAECGSRDERKRPQLPTSAHRSRSSEVHNLSERRRRDRINEKMKVLQELIPHCNKTDKASMLDEAIEYLKSLQHQVQVMWMGNGMAPVMLRSVQHYLSSLTMGMGHGPSVSTPPAQLSVPIIDPVMSYNLTNQAAVLAKNPPASQYLGFNPIEPPPLEVPNFYNPSHSFQFQRVPTVGARSSQS